MPSPCDTDLQDLVRTHGPDLRQYARSLLSDGAADPDDVLQEVWLRAHRSLPADADPRAWLFRVTRNCAIDARRRAPGAAPEALLETVPARTSVPDEAATREAVRDALTDIASLDRRQHAAFVRHVLDGASHEEVARELRVSQQGSKSLVLRARRNLERRALARGLPCDDVRRALDDAGRRGTRSTELVRLHLQTCGACRRHRGEHGHRSWLGLPWVKVAAGLLAAGAVGGGWSVTRADVVEPWRDRSSPSWTLGPGTAFSRHEVEVREEGLTRLVVDLRCPDGYRLFQIDQGLGPATVDLRVPGTERWLGRGRLGLPVTPLQARAALPRTFTVEATCRRPASLLRSIGDPGLRAAVRRNVRAP